MVSWMVSGAAVPLPGPYVVEAFQQMYGLLGVDVWSHPVVHLGHDVLAPLRGGFCLFSSLLSWFSGGEPRISR